MPTVNKWVIIMIIIMMMMIIIIIIITIITIITINGNSYNFILYVIGLLIIQRKQFIS